MPSLLEGHITGYFEYLVACDRMCNSDLQAVTKGKAMLEARRAEACSYAATDHGMFYSGTVRALMEIKGQNNFQYINNFARCYRSQMHK